MTATVEVGPCRCGGYGVLYDRETTKQTGRCHDPGEGEPLRAIHATPDTRPETRAGPVAWDGVWYHSSTPDEPLESPQGPWRTEREARTWEGRYRSFRARVFPLYANERLRDVNESVRVCSAHTAAIVEDGGCSVCEVERLRERVEELEGAVRPFANFACDEPHVEEPECHNCRARRALRGET